MSKLLGVILLLASLQAGAATYYVATTGNDNNAGTKSLPWLTITKAANTLIAGDTVFVRGGTYSDQVRPVNSGNSINGYITYSAYPGETVTLSGVTLYQGWSGVLDVLNDKYIQFSGFTVNSSPGFGVRIEDASNIRVINNTFSTSGYSGIGCYDSKNLYYDKNTIINANTLGNQESISLERCNNFQVLNNIIYDGQMEGIDAKVGSSYGIIAGNELYNMKRVGIYVDAWDITTQSIDIYGNKVRDSYPADSGTAQDGIRIGAEHGGLAKNINIYNNLLYNLYQSGVMIAAYAAVGTPTFDNIKIYNNTIHGNGIPSNFGGINVEATGVNNIKVINNVVSDNQYFGIRVTSSIPSDKYLVDYNLIDKTGGAQSSSTNDGTNAILVDPLFVNVGTKDFRLQASSQGINTGTSTLVPTKDYTGYTRNICNAVDRGAFEYH